MKTLVKVIAIVLVFGISFVSLIELKGETQSGRKLHKMVFIETASDWAGCQLQNCRQIDDGLLLPGGIEPARATTGIINPDFSFDEVILSWNATPPDSTGILHFDVEVSQDSETWSKFNYQTWGALKDSTGKEPRVSSIENVGKMLTDYLVLTSPMRYARVRVTSSGGISDVILRRLALSFSAKNSSWDDYKNYHSETPSPKYGTIKLAVPYYTQRGLPKGLSGNCCSPTSVCMVLNYYGKNFTVEQFARQVYDPRGDMYGNWPHNMAAAYAAGMGRTWVESHCGFDEIYDEVANGKPIVISIAYDYDQLPHSPIHEAPEGHLITVIGFDGPNTVICSDPAGHTIDDGIISYPRKELEEIWINHGGIAYHLWPE